MDANCLTGVALTADGGRRTVVPDTPPSSYCTTNEQQPDGLSQVRVPLKHLLQT